MTEKKKSQFIFSKDGAEWVRVEDIESNETVVLKCEDVCFIAPKDNVIGIKCVSGRGTGVLALSDSDFNTVLIALGLNKEDLL